VAVLTARPELPIHRDLEAEASASDTRLVVLDACASPRVAAPPGVWSGGRELSLSEVRGVLPRVGNWRPDSTLAVLAAMQAAGVPSLNDVRRSGSDATTGAPPAPRVSGLPHPRPSPAPSPRRWLPRPPRCAASRAWSSCGTPAGRWRHPVRGPPELRTRCSTPSWRLGDELWCSASAAGWREPAGAGAGRAKRWRHRAPCAGGGVRANAAAGARPRRGGGGERWASRSRRRAPSDWGSPAWTSSRTRVAGLVGEGQPLARVEALRGGRRAGRGRLVEALVRLAARTEEREAIRSRSAARSL